jgi:uncharacterized membrane protein
LIGELRAGLTVATALGSGLVGGIFFAFSTFVMRSLASQPPASGIATMQAINVKVLNGWFLTAFMGTAGASLVVVVVSLTNLPSSAAVLRLGGGLLYLVGCFGVTIAFNVPRNDALAAVDPGSLDGAAVWADYVTSWTTWNTVRTIASLLAATALTISLVIE